MEALIDAGRRRRVSLAALVFDFDGLILDTEWSAFSTAAEVWSEHGIELDLAVWQEIVGTAEHVHWSDLLDGDLGRPIDRATVIPARQAHHHAEVEAMDLLPGAEDLIRAASVAGLGLAVASSSPLDWVGGHLERRGLIGYFAVDRLPGPRHHDQARPRALHHRRRRPRGRPGPRRRPRGLPPRHRRREGRRPGLRRGPNRVTAGQDFHAASLVVDSLEHVTIPLLEDLLAT